jgi:23S rRNA pseudouridine2605 synthase
MVKKQFTCWVIVAGAQPTAFRARTVEELLPTLKQLQRTQPNVELRWFERGRFWTSPEEARTAFVAKSRSASGRGRDWRPGGDHRDPRARYDVPRDVRRARFKERQRFDERPRPDEPRRERRDEGTSGRPPDHRPPWKPSPDRPFPPRENRGRSDRPFPPRENRGRSDRPFPPRENRARSDRPFQPRENRFGKGPKPGGPDGGSRRDRPPFAGGGRPGPKPKGPGDGFRRERPPFKGGGGRPGPKPGWGKSAWGKPGPKPGGHRPPPRDDSSRPGPPYRRRPKKPEGGDT